MLLQARGRRGRAGGRCRGAARTCQPAGRPRRGGTAAQRSAPHRRLPPAAALGAPRRREGRRASGGRASGGRGERRGPGSLRQAPVLSPEPRSPLAPSATLSQSSFPKSPLPKLLPSVSPRFKLARVLLASHLRPPPARSPGSPLRRRGRTSPRSATGSRRPAAAPAAAPLGCRHNRCRGGARGGLGPSGLLSSVLGARGRADLPAVLREVVGRRLGWW